MENNMTTGKEWRIILAFVLPIMGSNLLQVLYNLADSVIVGNFIGPTALGAVGLTGSMCWLLLTFCTGLGAGASIVAAQFYGAGRQKDVSAAIGASYVLSVVIGLGLTALCLLIARPMVWGFLSAPADMRGMSVLYFCVYSCGAVFQMLYNVTYGILRAHGDSRGAMLFLLAAAVLNIVLDLLFIVAFGWGVGGAAAATILSQAGSAMVSMVYMARRYPQLRPRMSTSPDEREKMKVILKVSAPIIAQSAITAIGFTVLQRLINSFGTASIEGYAAMGKIEQLAHIPAKSFNTAISAFVGQNIGADRPDRARAGLRSSLLMGGAVTLVISAVVILLAEPMLGMFNISGESMRRGMEHLVLLMVFCIVNMVTSILSGFLQGTGDVRTPAVAGFADLSVRLISAHIMAATFIGFRSVYVSMPLAWLVDCAIVVRRYRSGGWRSLRLV